MAEKHIEKRWINVADSEQVYANDRRRTTVRKELENTLERELINDSLIRPIAIDEYNQKVKRVRTIADRHRRGSESERGNRHQSPETSSFPNRVITYFGEKLSSPESKAENVASNVESFVQLVLANVSRSDTRFRGNLVPCGSYYEGVKVKHPNEFDYIWELNQTSSLSCENLDFCHVRPETFKPRKQEDVYGRSYFKLAFKNNVPRNWQCGNCKNANMSTCTHNQSLEPRQIQEEFRNIVEKVTSKLVGDHKKALVKASGPAVTLYTELSSDRAGELITQYGQKRLKKHNIDFFLIKIDITLAIPIKQRALDNRWPFQDDVHSTIELAEEVNANCHVVAAGDFWRLSFSKLETEKMYELTANDENRKYCFRALKCIRDELSLTSQHETGLLGTYPLKVTFLKENKQFDKKSDWSESTMSLRTKNILKVVEEDGEEGRLTSYFVKNDPILLESDRCYLESKRIQQYLEKMAHHYRINGYVNMSILLSIIITQILLLSMSLYYLKTKCETDGFKLSDYIFSVLPLSFVSFVMSLVGFLWIVIQRWCLRSTNVIYVMYMGILYAYVGFTILTLIQSGMSISLAIQFAADKCKNTLIRNTSLTICFIAVAILLYMIIHTAIFALYSRKHIKYYSWEIVFFDAIYKHMCNCCLSIFHKKDSPPPDVPPRMYSRQENLMESSGRFVQNPNLAFEPDESVYEDTTDVITATHTGADTNRASTGVRESDVPPPLPSKRNQSNIKVDQQDAILQAQSSRFSPLFQENSALPPNSAAWRAADDRIKVDLPPPVPKRGFAIKQQASMDNDIYFSADTDSNA